MHRYKNNETRLLHRTRPNVDAFYGMFALTSLKCKKHIRYEIAMNWEIMVHFTLLILIEFKAGLWFNGSGGGGSLFWMPTHL